MLLCIVPFLKNVGTMMTRNSCRDWISDEGQVRAISKSQFELVNSEPGIKTYNQFNFFKQSGRSDKAQELRDNMNAAMQLAYERDTGVSRAPAISTQGPSLV